MIWVYLLIFLLLLIGPIALAWFKGEQFLDYLSRRKKHQQMQNRQRATRALPVRESALEILLAAEQRRNQIDERIGNALARFRQTLENVRTPFATPQTLSAVEEIEQLILSRESQFSDVLDIAGLQSETIELRVGEVDLLRQMAEYIHPPNLDEPTQAKAHLLANLERAVQKRKKIDHQLNRFHPRTSKSGHATGFDITIT